MSFICEIDGKSYRKLGLTSSCPSVVYLLPGRHILKLEYRSANVIGTAEVPISAVAGKSYQIIATSWVKVNEKGYFYIHEMPAGFTLTYRDIAPVYFRDGTRPNSPVDPSIEN